MEVSIPARERLATARRAGRIFVKRLHGRSTLIIVLLVALVISVALATVRNGASLGGITGSESTDDAYVRADQISIASHIAGYVESIPVQDNETVRRGHWLQPFGTMTTGREWREQKRPWKLSGRLWRSSGVRPFYKIRRSPPRPPRFAQQKRCSNKRDYSTPGSGDLLAMGPPPSVSWKLLRLTMLA